MRLEGSVTVPSETVDFGSSGGAQSRFMSSNFDTEREELERVINSAAISRSTSLVRFLSFICNKHFEGKAGEIREYTIAVGALGRNESNFDPQTDPIVRVTARVLRKKLSEYYGNEGKDHRLHIILPRGHYVPQFIRSTSQGARPDISAHFVVARQLEVEVENHDDNITSAARAAEISGNRRQVALVLAPTGFKWKMTLILVAFALSTSAIFLAGFFLGRRTDEHTVFNTESFKWGDPIWSDEFNGAAQQLPDPSKWTFDAGNQNGWGNQELEVYCSPYSGYTKECDPQRPNAFLDGSGHLVLRAQRNSNGVWTSARITTRGLRNFQYGRIEARMKLPVGAGLWPAFWMLGANFDTVGWPSAGSVDLVEAVSLSPNSSGRGPSMTRSTLHGPNYFKGNGLWHDLILPNGARVDEGGFHTYGVIWSPGMIQFYVDDPVNIFFVEDASELPNGGGWVFDHPFYLFINLAVGGNWPGNPDATTPNPADVLVDYVRAYKIPAVPAPDIKWQPVQVKVGTAMVTTISLRSRGGSGRVYLACSTEPATARCTLASSVVDFTNALSQEDTLTIATDVFTDRGRFVAPPGSYKLTITATSISGDRSQLTVPFEIKSNE
ncbi:MAG: glycoside hydrolase family 16 protein [Terracidiphilus sp.]